MESKLPVSEKLRLIEDYLAETGHLNPNWVEMIREYREMLKATQQGRLVELPCKVGDVVYFISQYGREPYCGIQNGHVQRISLSKKGFRIRVKEHHPHNTDFAFGKTIFLTLTDAKAALKEMEGVDA